jgi:hypothetical protein
MDRTLVNRLVEHSRNENEGDDRGPRGFGAETLLAEPVDLGRRVLRTK